MGHKEGSYHSTKHMAKRCLAVASFLFFNVATHCVTYSTYIPVSLLEYSTSNNHLNTVQYGTGRLQYHFVGARTQALERGDSRFGVLGVVPEKYYLQYSTGTVPIQNRCYY